MIFSKKNKEGKKSINLTYIDGIENYAKGTAIELSLDDEGRQLSTKARVYKNPPVYLPYDQITEVKVVSEKDIIEKSKTVLGRAFIGSIFLGPLGAIVGGMSGVGSKQKSETNYFMIINYKSKDEELKALCFEIVGATFHLIPFVEEFRKKITIGTVIDKEIYL